MKPSSRAIMLVEDSPDDAELTIHALEENGVKNPIVVAKDGVEAVELLLGTPSAAPIELPLLVLLDLNLPRLNGIEVLKRIRASERTRVLPVIVLTSSNEDRDLVASYQLGANSYVCKPVDFDEFRAAARQLSMYWLMLNEPPPVPQGA